jgi:hypothetical protein
MSFEPQTAVEVLVIPIDACLEQTPTQVEACLLACPDNVNMQVELLSVGVRANTVPIDAGTTTVDIEFIDDSNSDTPADLLAGFDLTGITVLIYNPIWRGSQILDAGDVINAEFVTDGAISTASEGAALIVEYRVLRRS